MTFEDFLKENKKVSGPRKHKIKDSYGAADYFQYYKKNGGKIDISTYRKVLRAINKEIQKEITNGNSVSLPKSMGALTLLKVKDNIRYKDNKLIVHLPINWQATNKLWYEDAEAREKKLLVRTESRVFYKVIYLKKNAIYINSSFFRFRPTRELKILIKNKAESGTIEALPYERYGNQEYKFETID